MFAETIKKCLGRTDFFNHWIAFFFFLVCLFASLSASVGTMWTLLVGYIPNPVHGLQVPRWFQFFLPDYSYLRWFLFPSWRTLFSMCQSFACLEPWHICLFCLEYTAPFYLLMWISMLWVERYRNSHSTSFGKRIHWRHAVVSHKTIWRAGSLGLGNNWHKKLNCCLHSPVWPLCYPVLPSLIQTSLSHNFLPPYVKNREPLWFTESPAYVDYPTAWEALIFFS